MLTYSVVTTVDELNAYRRSWTKILQDEQNNNPFIEFEWIYYWWQHIAENEQIRIYVIQQDGKPIAFIPLEKKKMLGVNIFSYATFPEANYMDVIARKIDKKNAIFYLLQTLEKRYPHAVFRFNGLLESSDTTAHIEAYFIEHCTTYRLFRTVSPVIQLQKLEAENLLYKRRNMHGVNRRTKRLTKLGQWQFVEVESSDFYNMVSIFKKRWKKKHSKNRFAEFNVQQLFHSIANNEAAVDVRVHALLFEGKWIAFALGVSCRDRYIGYTLGHDPAFDMFGPGRITDQLLIQAISKEGFSLFDLSIGYESYKYDWHTVNDFVLSYISSTKSLKAGTVALAISTRSFLVSLLNKQRWFVRLKRKVLDTLSYSLRSVNIKELFSFWKQLFTVEWVNIYEKQLVQDDITRKQTYIEQKLKEVPWDKMNVSLMYKGYRFFKEESLNKNTVFIYHDKVLRYDEIALLEPIPSKTAFLSQFEETELATICHYFYEQQYKKILAINPLLKKRRAKKLLNEKFFCIEQIFYMKFLKWEFRRVRGVDQCKLDEQTRSLQSSSNFSKKL
ncbi:GNAT family N-acetyltransferase [Solibacillus sp. CAU 1738]|uniref:GNAT family N-acetyltransferase n=1 Tax=Solibacillus sp. CAU 1738 TaxID=3140363 RepID=UPI00326196C9